MGGAIRWVKKKEEERNEDRKRIPNVSQDGSRNRLGSSVNLWAVVMQTWLLSCALTLYLPRCIDATTVPPLSSLFVAFAFQPFCIIHLIRPREPVYIHSITTQSCVRLVAFRGCCVIGGEYTDSYVSYYRHPASHIICMPTFLFSFSHWGLGFLTRPVRCGIAPRMPWH